MSEQSATTSTPASADSADSGTDGGGASAEAARFADVFGGSDLGAVSDASNVPSANRDPANGQFAKPADSAVSDPQALPKADDAATPAADAPKTETPFGVAPDVAAAFAAAPPALQRYIAEQTQAFQQHAQGLVTEANERLTQQHNTLQQMTPYAELGHTLAETVLGSNREYFEGTGRAPVETIARLVQFDQQLSADPKGALAYLCSRLQIDPFDLIGAQPAQIGQPQQQQQRSQDPDNAKLRDQLAHMQREREAIAQIGNQHREQQARQQFQASLAAEIKSAAERFPEMGDINGEILVEQVTLARTNYPQASPRQILNHAVAQAKARDPGLVAKAEARKSAAVAEAAKKAKIATAQNVSTAHTANQNSESTRFSAAFQGSSIH